MKKFFITLMCIVMVVCFMPTVAMAETGNVQTGYGTETLPTGPDISGNIINVNATNIQYTLDGAYGCIDGKTIVLSSGNYEKIELGRATKYPGSNTDYYIGGIAEGNKKTFDEFVAIKNSDQWSASAYYVRNMSNVTIKAAEGAIVTVAGIIGTSGHVYGESYDYVLDKAYTSGSAYYLTQDWHNITIEGITFTAPSNIASDLGTTVIDDVTFKNCNFNINSTASGNQALRYYNENNDGNVKNLTVEKCSFNTCYQGVYTNQVNGVEIINCSFDTTGHNAIAVQSSVHGAVNHKAVVIKGNTFANIGNRIIRFGDVAADTQITIKNNTASNSGDSNGEVMKAQSLAEGVTYDICGNSWGEGKTVANNGLKDGTAVAEVGNVPFTTLEKAIAAATDGDTVILLGDLKINTQIDISTGKNIVLDLGGHKLSSDLPTAIKLTHGCLNVENGTIEANGEAFRINGNTSEASLKIASNVEVVSNEDCCVFMYGGGAKLFTSGNLTSKGVYATIQGNGLASSAGTLIDISGGKITHSDSVAIYHPQNGIMNITGGVIEGSTGIYFKSGSLNITGGTIKGKGNKAEFVHNGNGCNSTGDGLVIEACDYPGGHPTVNISGGTFTSDHADAIGYYEYQGNSMSNKKFISGGKFTPAVNNDYLAPGVVQDSKGNVYKPYYGGSIPTDSLKTARTEAIKAVTDYVNAADYEEAQQAEIKTIVDNAKKNIEAAKTADEIKAIEAAAKAELDKLETAEEMALIRTIEGTQFTARSKATTLNGKKAIRVTWNKPADLDFDGYEIYRSTERYKGYGTEPFFTTTNQKYTNNKGLKVGKTYYYKVRGFKYVNDEKVYTEYSLKAWRTVK